MITLYFELFDDEAVVCLKQTTELEKLLTEMPAIRANVPEEDGRECQVTKWLESELGIIIITYVSRNDAPKLNGWALRYYGGVKLDSDEHIQIIRACERKNGRRCQWQNE